MSDINLGKLFIGKEDEKELKELLHGLTELVMSAQTVIALAKEVLADASISINNVNEITEKVKAVLK